MILSKTFVRRTGFPAAVVLWNIFDQEHVEVLHGSYIEARVMHEDEKHVLQRIRYRLPFFPFIKHSSMSLMTMTGEWSLNDYQLVLFGIPSLASYEIEPHGEEDSTITATYRVVLRGWQKMLAPILRRMMAVWQEKVWEEDLPLKERRTMVLKWGFQDFVGLKEKVEDRVHSGKWECKLPIPRPKESPMDDWRRGLKAGDSDEPAVRLD